MRTPAPPELTEEQKSTMNSVRKEIWTNAGTGLVAGSLAGIALHSVASYGQGYYKQLKLNSSTALVSVLAGGALGSYVMATTTGKNQVHNLHPIFETNKQLPVEQQQEQAMEQLERNRIMRRESLKQNMEHQHGLADAHGGHWKCDKDEKHRQELVQNRLVRRASVQHHMQHGHGLSDSHGGRWIK